MHEKRLTCSLSSVSVKLNVLHLFQYEENETDDEKSGQDADKEGDCNDANRCSF